MKTAVIYTGHARTFKDVFANQYWKVLRHLPDPHFFVSVVDDDQAPDMMRLLERFPTDRVTWEYVTQPPIVEDTPTDPWLAGYNTSATPSAILRQLWALDRAWTFFEEHADLSEFDCAVRIRPDLAFLRFEIPFNVAIQFNTSTTPYWSRWGGVNDRVAVLGMQAAPHYFQTYRRREALWKAGCPCHPEQMIAASLELGDVRICHTLATEFVTVRLNGQVIPYDATMIDIAEYARR